MKPCHDETTIQRLIDKHKEMAIAHEVMAHDNYERAETLNEYLKELNRPGFKLKNRVVIISGKRKPEHIITCGNTWDPIG